jgi:hypothetical protein
MKVGMDSLGRYAFRVDGCFSRDLYAAWISGWMEIRGQ